MSSEPAPRDDVHAAPDPSEAPGAWIRANEAWLRETANSDSNISWIAEELLHSEGLSP